jgi:hypothetical protein
MLRCLIQQPGEQDTRNPLQLLSPTCAAREKGARRHVWMEPEGLTQLWLLGKTIFFKLHDFISRTK